MRKTPLDEIVNSIKCQGYKLIEIIGEYRGVKTSAILECENGHQLKYEIQAFQNGRRCSKCKGTYQQDHTFEEVYKYYQSKGCLLLETEYRSVHTPMRYICSCGNEGRMNYKDFKNGHRCKICSGKKKYEYNEVVKIFEEQGCHLLSTEYNRNKQDLDYICSCGNISKIKLSDFMHGVRCRKCYLETNIGENHPNWKPDKKQDNRISERRYFEYTDWRNSVFERDNYLCQVCKDKSHYNLSAHHLDGYNWCEERRTDITNGITLCKECHDSFHKQYGFGWNTTEQFYEFINRIQLQQTAS